MCMSSGPTALYAKFVFWRKTYFLLSRFPLVFGRWGDWLQLLGFSFSFFTPGVSHGGNLLSPLSCPYLHCSTRQGGDSKCWDTVSLGRLLQLPFIDSRGLSWVCNLNSFGLDKGKSFPDNLSGDYMCAQGLNQQKKLQWLLTLWIRHRKSGQ